MEFEYDEFKSKRNKEKHGIDFVEAQLLWDDPDRMEIPAKAEDESRFVVIGKMGEKHWSAIVTYREKKVRIISVRRSRKEEIEFYES
ncbi:MAG: BrnT family toxin [Deltaproteobacteria bacterium]|nr:BrnT family toxin [Deltaproteobacteria bacterium]